MHDIAVIEDPAAAESSLDPIRSRILAELTRPGSATTLAGKLGLPRQKINYHLRTLEHHGLVHLVSPAALAAVAPDPGRAPDRLSARWLLALAARLVRDVGTLITGADRTHQRVATYATDGEIRFATPADRAAFADELTAAVTALTGKYHSETGRKHRLVVAVHPALDSQKDNH
jgi:DNA-binding GntR family transcriptional regulator